MVARRFGLWASHYPPFKDWQLREPRLIAIDRLGRFIGRDTSKDLSLRMVFAASSVRVEGESGEEIEVVGMLMDRRCAFAQLPVTEGKDRFPYGGGSQPSGAVG